MKGKTMADEKKIDVILLRDFWPADDQRVAAGTVVQVDVETAMDMVEKGLGKRDKKG
jgi:hypothetical protein